MALQKYPSRTEPFVSQRSPKGRRGQGFGIGALVFIFVLVGVMLVVLYVITPLMEDVVFPDIGIPYAMLFLIFVGCILIVSIALMVRSGIYADNRIMYRDRDPSICQRVIKDGYDGHEVIISGPREATFAEVCQENWPFKNVPQKSGWFIRDAQGNDVTNASLETVDGIFILIPEYGSESQKELQPEEPDKSDEYSSIHDSVTYYD